MTKKLKWLGLAAAAALSMPMGVHAAEPAMYAGVHLGQNNLHSWPLRVDFGGISSTGGLGLDRGAHWGLFVGRQRDDSRMEIEYQHGRIDVTRATVGAVSQAHEGHGDYQALMFNAYRVVDVRPDFNLYGALGVGLGRISLPSLPPLSGCICLRGASNTDFAFQVKVGAEYQFAGANRVFLQYSALHLPSAASGSPTPTVYYRHRDVVGLSVGYRRTF